MPANSRWDLIQRERVKIVKNPGNGHLNNLNDPSRPECVNRSAFPLSQAKRNLSRDAYCPILLTLSAVFASP